MKNKKIKYIIAALILIAVLCLGICLIIISCCYNYQLWLNEYNAQIATYGVYKEDLHILNQYWENKGIEALAFAGVIMIFADSVGIGLYVFNCFIMEEQK